MSRLWGGRSLSSRSPSQSCPVVGVSSPAIRFSVVDFPQPLGPTNVKNSPAAMFSEGISTARRSLKLFLRFCRRRSILTFDRSCGEPADNAALEYQHERHAGQS